MFVSHMVTDEVGSNWNNETIFYFLFEGSGVLRGKAFRRNWTLGTSS